MTALPADLRHPTRLWPASALRPRLLAGNRHPSAFAGTLAATIAATSLLLQAGFPPRGVLALSPWLLLALFATIRLISPGPQAASLLPRSPSGQSALQCRPERSEGPADLSRDRGQPATALAPAATRLRHRLSTLAFTLGIAGIIALAAALRLFRLDGRSIWLDEAISVWAGHLPWSSLMPLVARHDDSPPLYFALLHLWMAFGDDERWLRLLSVLCSLAAVALGARLAYRLVGRTASFMAALLLAVSTVQVAYAQEARMYALVAALTPAVVLLSLKALQGRLAWAIVWGLALAALAATHHTAALASAATVAGSTLVVLIHLVGGNRAPAYRLGIAVLVAGAAWSPLFPLFREQTRHVAQHYWIPRPTPAYAIGEMLGASIGTPPPASHLQVSDPPVLDSPAGILYAALALPRTEPLRRLSLAFDTFSWLALPALGALLIAGLAAVRGRLGPAPAVILAAAIVLPVLALLAASQVRPILIARAMMGSGTLVLVLVAVACAWLPRWLGLSALALVLCLQMLGLGEQWWYPFDEAWRPAVAKLVETGRPGDLVFVEGRWSTLPLDYYLRRTPSVRFEEHGIPVDFGVGGKPEPVTSPADVPRILALAAGHDRVWLVSSHSSDVDPDNFGRKTLEAALPCFDVWPYQGVSLALFTRC